MAVRDESVRLSLIDDYTSPMVRAAAATRLLARALNDVDGTNTRLNQNLGQNNGLPRLGQQANQTGSAVDRLSGRLGILADVAGALGPALVPLGAAGVGGLAAVASQLTVAASAGGVAALAIVGLGDGLKALNDYQLEPTQANLEKLDQDFRSLGHAGRQFALYLDSIGPQLQSLQRAARSGLLPGAAEGIDELLTSLPEVRKYVRDVSTILGGLAADAGADLVGPDWQPFFSFIREDGLRLLDELGRSTGNVAQGLGNMLAGFAPVTEDFSAGLLDATERFADWSTTLDKNASFQKFLDYIEEAGPKAIDLLSSLGDATANIATAAAPIGDLQLDALTGVIDAFATLAGSDLGPPLLALAGAMGTLRLATRGLTAIAGSGVMNRTLVAPIRAIGAAAPTLQQTGLYFRNMGQFAGLASTQTLAARQAMRGFVGSFRGLAGATALAGGMALAMTGVADSTGLSNTLMLGMMGTMAGPWGVAAGVATGVALDLAEAGDDVAEAIKSADDALSSMNAGRIEAEIAKISETIRQVEDDLKTDSFGEFFANTFDPDVWEDFTRAAWGAETQTDKLRKKQEELEAALRDGGSAWRQLIALPSGVAREFDVARQSLDEFAQSFTDLNNLLDRSGSLVNYERALDDLRKTLKESSSVDVGIEKGRANIEGFINVVNRATERSEVLKKAGDNLGALRILRRAKSDLLDFADGNKAAMRLIKPYVDELDRLSSKRIEARLDADGKPLEGKVTKAQRRLAALTSKVNEAVISGNVEDLIRSLSRADRELLGITQKEWRAVLRGDVGSALAAIGGVKRELQSIPRTITTTIITRRVGSATPRQADLATSRADGGTIPGQRTPYRDKVLAYLAPGEEVISNRYGQADRFRADRAAGRIPRYADGGTVGDGRSLVQVTYSRSRRDGDEADKAAGGLKRLRERLKDATREVEQNTKSVAKERRQRDAAVERRDSVASSVSEGIRSDIFAPPENVWSANANAGANGTIDADIAKAREVGRLVKELRRKGLDGPALAELVTKAIENDDVTLLRTYAEMSKGALATYERKYERRDQILASVGMATGNAAYSADVREQTRELRAATRELRESKQELREIKRAIDKADKGNRDGHKKTAEKTEKADGAARAGTRRAPRS